MNTARNRCEVVNNVPTIGMWGWLPPVVMFLLAILVVAFGLNTTLFEEFNQLPVYTGDALWANLTVLGDTVVAFALLLPWSRHHPEMLWAAFIAALPASVWVDVLKPLLHHPRPAAVLPVHLVHVIGPRLLANSFPSGHTTTVFTLAGVLALSRVGMSWRMICLSLAILVGISRSAVGAHWPLDELGGAFGGWLAAWAGVIGARRWNFGLRPVPRRVFAGLCLCCTLVLFVYDGGYSQARLTLDLLAVTLLATAIFQWSRNRHAAR